MACINSSKFDQNRNTLVFRKSLDGAKFFYLIALSSQKSSCQWTFSSFLLRAASSKEVLFFLLVSVLFYEIHQEGGHGGLRYCGFELFFKWFNFGNFDFNDFVRY